MSVVGWILVVTAGIGLLLAVLAAAGYLIGLWLERDRIRYHAALDRRSGSDYSRRLAGAEERK